MRRFVTCLAAELFLAACVLAAPNEAYIKDAHIRDDAGIQPHKIRGLVDLTSMFGGRTWFVNSANTGAGDGGGYGATYKQPFATLGYAVSVASAGDLILIAAGHTEAVTSAGAITLDKAITIVGCGYGERRPKFTFSTSTAADIQIREAGVSIYNCIFECDKTGANHVRMIAVLAPGALIENCLFRAGTTTEKSLAFIVLDGYTASPDYCTIRNNAFISATAGAEHAIAIDYASTGLVLEGNYIFGNYSAACVHSGVAHTACFIHHNSLTNTANGKPAIGFAVAATGAIEFNTVNSPLAAAATKTGIDPGACYCNENYGSDGNGDVSGVLNPASDT